MITLVKGNNVALPQVQRAQNGSAVRMKYQGEDPGFVCICKRTERQHALDTLSRGQSESEPMAQTRTLPSFPQAFQHFIVKLQFGQGRLERWWNLVQGFLCVIRTSASVRQMKACKEP